MGHKIDFDSKETKVFNETYNGQPMFAIWPVNAEGTKSGAFPVISIGKKKAKALIKHLEELKKYVEES